MDNWIDKLAMAVSPSWGRNRLRARAEALHLRNYLAASGTRRTTSWPRSHADANAANGPSLHILRAHARDARRNLPWARKAVVQIGNEAVSWGIVPKASGGGRPLAEKWARWAKADQCDSEGRLTFAGLQRLVMRTVVESGEVLVRRRWRRESDGLAFPLQLQVLEPDFLDTAKDGMLAGGGFVVQGVEYNAIGKRVAYWLFRDHPGSGRLTPTSTSGSVRYPAEDIIHVFRSERPGQVRGVSWFAPALVKLKELDEYNDATLMRQRVAACFSAFVTNVDGSSPALGTADDDADLPTDTLEPGMISYLSPGESVEFANPPTVGEHSSFTADQLRAIAAAMDITYEDLTGDYSRVNFSSARMARIGHWPSVWEWREDLLIPQLCDGVWRWCMESTLDPAMLDITASWTAPPMPMLEPDKEGLAYMRAVRSGQMTLSGMLREQGLDPEEHLAEYAADLKRLDELGIVLDCDARRVTQAGMAQADPEDPEDEGGEDAEDVGEEKSPDTNSP